MKRSDIRGFTIKVMGYYFEVVTAYHLPVVFAISKGRDLVYRGEMISHAVKKIAPMYDDVTTSDLQGICDIEAWK